MFLPQKEGPPIAVGSPSAKSLKTQLQSKYTKFLRLRFTFNCPMRAKEILMPDAYIPYSRTIHSMSSQQARLVPFRPIPADATRTQFSDRAVSRYLNALPRPKPSFDQLLKSIKEMDELVSLPLWHNYMSNERALELSRVLRDFGGYGQARWNFTSGSANPFLSAQIRFKFPLYPSFYSENGFFRDLVIPGTNVKLDVPHFNATLSKYLDNEIPRCYIPSDWAGWAGDMFTFADELDSFLGKSGIGLDDLRRFASLKLGAPKDSMSLFKNKFGQEDFYADIDARNISTLINSGLSYHDAMNNYYKNNLYGRFGHFINSYGGWKNFEKHVNSFNFFPLTPLVNPIFVDAAKRAFVNKVREGCLNEMDCNIP